MRRAAFDTETWPVRPGQKAPRLVCISFGTADEAPRLYHREDRELWIPELVHVLREADEIRNQNIGFDWGVIVNELRRLRLAGYISPPVFKELCKLVWGAYDADRVRDPMVTAMLISIALGEPMTFKARKIAKLHSFSLESLVGHYLGEAVEDKDERVNYWKLDNVPVCDWPPARVAYACNDPVYADRLFNKLRSFVGNNRPRSEKRNTRAAWCLMLAEAWGVRTDPRYVRALKTHLLRQRAEAFATIRQTIGSDGWLRPDGSRDMKKKHARIVEACERAGTPVERTAKGAVKTSREILEKLEPVAPDLGAWARIGATNTELNTFVPSLERGLALPINARWNVLVESERLSCDSPNLTNQPTRSISLLGDDDPVVMALVEQLATMGLKPEIGIRSCFIPRPGWYFAASDYATAEMRGFAQVCFTWFGFSKMRDVLIANKAAQLRGEPTLDLHDLLAARILGLTDEQALAQKKHDPYTITLSDGRVVKRFKTVRQLAKRINFGCLGGMGDERFVATAQKDGVDITLGGLLGEEPLPVAKRLRAIWFELYPEVPRYFREIGNWIRQSGGDYFRATSFSDGLIRGNVRFTDGANHFFQNLIAQWLKDALYLVFRECYLVEDSPLYGCRPVILPHDEIITEVPIHRAHEAAMRQAELQRIAGQNHCPDVPVEVDPALMRRWYKGAEPVFGPDKRLVPWEPLAA